MRDARESGLIAAARLDEIGQCSLPGAGVTRLPFSDEHGQANQKIAHWMQRAGMDVTLDAAGTLIGRIEGRGPRRSQTFILGSHQDSVINGGGYDGIMGVALACLAVETCFENGVDPDFSIEVHAYADEEGVRFPTALLGPRAIAGSFDPAVLKMMDANGETICEAIQAFGGDPNGIVALKRNSNSMLGYLELHIEQGPMLEQEDLAAGVVTAICGIERNTVTVKGKTGHAGTVPMQGRQDALVAASRIIANANQSATQIEDLRATVGTLSVLPGAVNQIPETVRFSLEIRSPDDELRTAFNDKIMRYARFVSKEQGCLVTIEKTYEQSAQACDLKLISHLSAASDAEQGRTFHLSSGATHDASAIAAICPIAMLFVRCRDGVSHVPEEYASPEDMGTAITIAARFLQLL